VVIQLSEKRGKIVSRGTFRQSGRGAYFIFSGGSTLKKRSIWYCVVADLLGIAIVPINLFLLNMPEYITIIISAFIIAAVVWFFHKYSGKTVSKVILSIIAAVCVAFTLFCSYCNPYWNSLMFKDYVCTAENDTELTFQEAKTDLDYAMHYLKKDHPMFISNIPDETQKAYTQVVNALKNADTITVMSLQQMIQSIVSSLNDEHTSCWRYERKSISDEDYNGQNDETPKSFVYYEIDAERDLAILTLDNCRFNDEYRNCLQAMFTEIKEIGINNIAVDLRSNGGGSSSVANEFIKYLDIDTYKTATYEWRFGVFILPSGDGIIHNEKVCDLLFEGNVFILTSSDTFSSAMLFSQ